MNRTLLILPALLLALTLTAPRASAQVGHDEVSLEWLVASADSVVRATVARVTREPARDQWVWLTVTLAVRETLKGKPYRSITVAEHTLTSVRIYEEWRDLKREQLWFLQRNEQFGKEAALPADALDTLYPLRLWGGGWSILRLGPPTPAEASFTRLPPPIFTMELKLSSEPRELLAAVRRAVRETPAGQPASSHLMILPNAMMVGTGRGGDVDRITFPVDRRLERLARRLVREPETFVPPLSAFRPMDEERRQSLIAALRGTPAQLKAEGAKALAYFKSPENAALLRTLLNDPNSSLVGPAVDPAPEHQVREYYVRKAAYTVLRDWGVEVKKPVLEEWR